MGESYEYPKERKKPWSVFMLQKASDNSALRHKFIGALFFLFFLELLFGPSINYLQESWSLASSSPQWTQRHVQSDSLVSGWEYTPTQLLNVATLLVIRIVVIVLQNCLCFCFLPEITGKIQKMRKNFYSSSKVVKGARGARDMQRWKEISSTFYSVMSPNDSRSWSC